MEKKKALVFSAIPLAGGMIIGYLTSRSGTYDAINRPPLSPPTVVFPIVWAILYILMGAALYLVLTSDAKREERQNAAQLFFLQLLFNFLWPIIFFSFQTFWAAVLCLIIMIVLIVMTIRAFGKIEPLAAKLLIPYLVWCIFALYLNIGVAILN